MLVGEKVIVLYWTNIRRTFLSLLEVQSSSQNTSCVIILLGIVMMSLADSVVKSPVIVIMMTYPSLADFIGAV